jgi:hypothetical protein
MFENVEPVKSKYFQMRRVFKRDIEFRTYDRLDGATFENAELVRNFLRRFYTLDMMQEETICAFVNECGLGFDPLLSIWGFPGAGKTVMGALLGYLCPEAIIVDNLHPGIDMDWLLPFMRKTFGKSAFILCSYPPVVILGTVGLVLPQVSLSDPLTMQHYQALREFGLLG